MSGECQSIINKELSTSLCSNHNPSGSGGRQANMHLRTPYDNPHDAPIQTKNAMLVSAPYSQKWYRPLHPFPEQPHETTPRPSQNKQSLEDHAC